MACDTEDILSHTKQFDGLPMTYGMARRITPIKLSHTKWEFQLVKICFINTVHEAEF